MHQRQPRLLAELQLECPPEASERGAAWDVGDAEVECALNDVVQGVCVCVCARARWCTHTHVCMCAYVHACVFASDSLLLSIDLSSRPPIPCTDPPFPPPPPGLAVGFSFLKFDLIRNHDGSKAATARAAVRVVGAGSSDGAGEEGGRSEL